jgi:ArsR family transcriptional regulator
MADARKVAPILKALGDERRVRLLRLLLAKNELCVCELVDAVNLPQYEVSRNLAALRKVGLVSDRREGLWAYYFIPESAHRDPFVSGLLKLINEQITGPKVLASDLVRLEDRLALRAGNQCIVGFRD